MATRLTREEANRLGLAHLWPRGGDDPAFPPKVEGKGQAPAPIVRPTPPADGMNKLERRFSRFLDDLKADGRIVSWSFESVKLRLAGRCFYAPDFFVVMPDQHVTVIETKGFMRDDAAVKIKVAADMYSHFMFLLARHDRKHGWTFRPVGRNGFGPETEWPPEPTPCS